MKRVLALFGITALVAAGGCASSHQDERVAQTPVRSDSRQHGHDYRNERQYEARPGGTDAMWPADSDQRVQMADVSRQGRTNLIVPADSQQGLPRSVVNPQSAAAQHIRVTTVSAQEPPLLLVETASRTIGENEFWVAGNWMVDESGFSWTAGRIERHRPGRLFAPAGWAASPRGWEFTPEYWR